MIEDPLVLGKRPVTAGRAICDWIKKYELIHTTNILKISQTL